MSDSNQQEQSMHQKGKKTLDTLYEISQIMGTGLDRSSLAICVSLCEQGIPPENVAVNYQYL